MSSTSSASRAVRQRGRAAGGSSVGEATSQPRTPPLPWTAARPPDTLRAVSAAAFFDLDRTLIRGSANFPLAVAAFRAGYVPPKDLLHDAVTAVSFVVRGSTDESSVALRQRILRAVAGHPAQDVIALGESFLPRIAAGVLPEARALLAEHDGRGEPTYVVSASPIEIVGRLAERIGMAGGVGTRSEIDADGRYTGELDGPFCYKEGKVAEVQRLAEQRGHDLAASYAYSDSISDLPFLQAVGHPVAVNPDRELRAHAVRHGWRVVEVAPSKRFAAFAVASRLKGVLRRQPAEVADAPQ